MRERIGQTSSGSVPWVARPPLEEPFLDVCSKVCFASRMSGRPLSRGLPGVRAARGFHRFLVGGRQVVFTRLPVQDDGRPGQGQRAFRGGWALRTGGAADSAGQQLHAERDTPVRKKTPPLPPGKGSLAGGGILVTGIATSDARIRSLSYMAPFLATAPAASELPAQQAMPIAGTMANLRVRIGTAPGQGNSYVLTIRKNGIGTGLACRIEGDGRADTSCLDNAHTVAFAAGDFLTLQVSPGGSPRRWHAARWEATLTP